MGRVSLTLASGSIAKTALHHAITAADNREVFGSNLLSLQATQTALLPALAESYANHFLTRDLIEEAHKGASRNFETKAAAIKAKTTDF